MAEYLRNNPAVWGSNPCLGMAVLWVVVMCVPFPRHKLLWGKSLKMLNKVEWNFLTKRTGRSRTSDAVGLLGALRILGVGWGEQGAEGARGADGAGVWGARVWRGGAQERGRPGAPALAVAARADREVGYRHRAGVHGTGAVHGRPAEERNNNESHCHWDASVHGNENDHRLKECFNFCVWLRCVNLLIPPMSPNLGYYY